MFNTANKNVHCGAKISISVDTAKVFTKMFISFNIFHYFCSVQVGGHVSHVTTGCDVRHVASYCKVVKQLSISICNAQAKTNLPNPRSPAKIWQISFGADINGFKASITCRR